MPHNFYLFNMAFDNLIHTHGLRICSSISRFDNVLIQWLVNTHSIRGHNRHTCRITSILHFTDCWVCECVCVSVSALYWVVRSFTWYSDATHGIQPPILSEMYLNRISARFHSSHTHTQHPTNANAALLVLWTKLAMIRRWPVIARLWNFLYGFFL